MSEIFAELHFIFECPCYSDLRSSLLHSHFNLRNGLIAMTNHDKLVFMLQDQVLINSLGKFLIDAFEVRKTLVDS